MTKKTKLARLLKLENDLRKYPRNRPFRLKGKTYRLGWDFQYWTSATELTTKGITADALGRMPLVDPRNWEYDSAAQPVLRKTQFVLPASAAATYFGLTPKEANALFIHYSPPETPFRLRGIRQLPKRATALQVADNIRRYRKWVEKNE